jgi:pyruvate kinase
MRASFRKLKEIYPEAEIAEKIESVRGLEYVRKEWQKDGKQPSRLMAARGDLYLELPWPHLITGAAEDIVRKDNDAIAASRIFDSMVESPVPSCADIGDTENLLRMGYRTFMFGDHICLERDSIISGLNVLYRMCKEYEKRV